MNHFKKKITKHGRSNEIQFYCGNNSIKATTKQTQEGNNGKKEVTLNLISPQSEWMRESRGGLRTSLDKFVSFEHTPSGKSSV